MKGKLLLVLFLLLISFISIAVYVLKDSPSGVAEVESILATNAIQLRDDSNTELLSRNQLQTSAKIQPSTSLNLKLWGVVLSSDPKQSTAVIESKTKVASYLINEQIAFTTAKLLEVKDDRVVLLEKGQLFELELQNVTRTNDKVSAYPSENTPIKSNGTDIETQFQFKKVGNRPKELKYIITLNKDNTRDEYSVSAGLNPALFRSAGFKEGDVLKEVNGYDINDAEDYKKIEALIPTAHSLAFSIVRGGVSTTLYLDIPSENLSLKN